MPGLRRRTLPHDTEKQETDRRQDGDGQHTRLQHIRPHHRLQAAQRGVHRRSDGDESESQNINDHRLRLPRTLLPRHGQVGHHQQNTRKVQPGTAGQHAAEQEGGTRPTARGDAETLLEILVNGNHLIIVVRLQEEPTHDNAAQDGADTQLHIGIIAQRKALPRGAQEGGRADLCRDDGAENGPPREGAVAQGIALQAFLPSPHIETYAEDGEEIKANDDDVRGTHGRDQLRA